MNRREYWRDFEYEDYTFDSVFDYELNYCFNKKLMPDNANVFYDFFNVLDVQEYPKALKADEKNKA